MKVIVNSMRLRWFFLFILCLSVGYWAVLSQKINDMLSIVTTIDTLEKSYRFEKHRLLSLKRPRHHQRNLLSDENERSDVLQKLSVAMRQSGLELLSFTPFTEKKNDFYTEIPVRLIVQGDYQHMLFFLKRAMKMPILFTWDEWIIEPSTHVIENDHVKMTWMVTLYVPSKTSSHTSKKRKITVKNKRDPFQDQTSFSEKIVDEIIACVGVIRAAGRMWAIVKYSNGCIAHISADDVIPHGVERVIKIMNDYIIVIKDHHKTKLYCARAV